MSDKAKYLSQLRRALLEYDSAQYVLKSTLHSDKAALDANTKKFNNAERHLAGCCWRYASQVNQIH